MCAVCSTAFAASGAAANGAESSSERGFADFNTNMLAGGARSGIDLSRFEKGAVVLPGTYSLDVYLNRHWVGRINVRFAAPEPGANARPCITPDLMERMGLQPNRDVPSFGKGDACTPIGQLITDASAKFDQPDLRLDVSVPQAYMNRMPRGYISPSSWDPGVTAGLLNYTLNTYHTASRGYSQTSAYLGLNAGINIGSWYVRQRSTATWQAGIHGQPARHRWNNIATYVQRDLPSLHAQLTMGDSYTDGTLFDSVSLRGVQLETDERMLPNSQRGYAPVVHGVARTNAKVTIRQNGVLLYQTTVAPGPFVINDLYPTGYGGDLDVEVTEADGSVHRFSVPYASVPQLLRSGTTRFQLASGHLRNPSLVNKPLITEGTLRHGFSNLFTGYTGAVGTRGYFAWLVGGAFNTRWGALALDATAARSKIPGVDTFVGRSYRLSYSRVLPVTDTSISVAAYRYSTHGYLGLNDAMRARDYAFRGLQVFATGPHPYASNGQTAIPNAPFLSTTNNTTSAYSGGIDRPRNRLSLTLSQRLGPNAGSLFIDAWSREYWNRRQRDTQLQIGYNNHFHRISYNLSATRTRDLLGRYDNRFFLGIHVALGVSEHAPNLSLNTNHDDQSGAQEQAIVSGSLGADNQFTYGASATHGNNGTGNVVSVNSTYRNPHALLGASYGKGAHFTQSSASVSGSIVAHPGGLTFGQPTGKTIAIVHAPGAEGARVTNASGVRVDADGYALVPYVNPYQLNTIRLDPQGMSLEAQLDSTSERVAPYAGAIVMVNFKTRKGRAMLAHIALNDGRKAPFGAQVLGAKGTTLGVVGQGGLALLRGVPEHGRLQLRWTGAQSGTHVCSFDYQLPAGGTTQGYRQVSVTCRDRKTRPTATGSGA